MGVSVTDSIKDPAKSSIGNWVSNELLSEIPLEDLVVGLGPGCNERIFNNSTIGTDQLLSKSWILITWDLGFSKQICE